jgi:Fe-S oxidoreductase
MPSIANAMMALMKPCPASRSNARARFAKKTFRQQFRPGFKWVRPHLNPRASNGKRVILWADTFNNHFTPETALAAVDVLERAGYRVEIPRKRVCCGRPLYDWGFLDLAKKQLRATLDVIDEDLPVIGLEPSCVSVFRDELPNLFPDDPRALQLAGNAVTLSEFLARENVSAAAAFEGPSSRRTVITNPVMRFDVEEAMLRAMGLDLTLRLRLLRHGGRVRLRQEAL